MNNIPLKPDSTLSSQSAVAHVQSSQKTNVASEKTIKTVIDQATKIPNLIMLSGTSTAGKSSIMSAFVKLHSNAQDLGIDDFTVNRTVQLLKRVPENATDVDCTKEYAILSKAIEDRHIRQLFIDNPTVIFKNDLTLKEAQAVMDLIDPKNEIFWNKVGTMLQDRGNFGPNKTEEDQAHFKEIVDIAGKGKTVIFDTSKSEDFLEFLKKNPCTTLQVHRFLVYAPLTHLLQRLEGRNKKAIEDGDVLNKRDYINVIDQFMRNYRRATATDVTIDRITRAEIEKIFKDYEIQIGMENKGSPSPFLPKSVLEHFGFTPTDNEVVITHNSQRFNGIFRTAQQNATQSATQLMSHTWQPFVKEAVKN